MKSKIDTFNQSNTLLVVSSYPDPTEGIKNLDAVAWHSQKTLRSLSANQKIVVFSNITKSTTPYEGDKNILVFPSWIKGNPLSLLTVLQNILKFSKAKTVLFQFEFNIFGGILPVIFIPIIISILKLSGKKIIFELHQVITNIRELSSHLNLKNPLFQTVFNFGLLGFYKTIGILVDNIVVLEEELKFRLQNFVNPQKITFIPISTIKQTRLNQVKAKKTLGYDENDFIVMSFGFINWYKGSDWIANAFSKIKDKHLKLILAGGPSPTLKDKPYYQKFFKKVETIAAASDNVDISGFIPEEKVNLYFSAADLLVLPYRVFMSSSGPLSLAYSYRKPIILADSLFKYTNSSDFKDSLEKSGLTTKDILFPRYTPGFKKHLEISKNTNLSKLTKFTELMCQSRSQENIKSRYQDLIDGLSYRHHITLQSRPCFQP